MNQSGRGPANKPAPATSSLLVSYRSGDVWAPRCEQTEALKVELGYFIDCIINDRTPINDGAAGLRIVQLLDAAEQSLKDRGKVITL